RRFAFIRELVKTRDRLMLECRVGPKLEQEPPGEAHIACDAGADRSQRNPAMKARMLGLIDGAEAVGVQLAQQAVPGYVLGSVGRCRSRVENVVSHAVPIVIADAEPGGEVAGEIG